MEKKFEQINYGIEGVNDEEKNKQTADAYFVHHSKAGYKTYAETEKSENPRAPFNPEKQITPDVPEGGIELAREKAEELFRSLNPGKDKLFFVSSNESRAIETANVFKTIAVEKGFEIIKPEKTKSDISDEIADGEIRILNNLSLNPKDTLLFNIFLPEKLLRPVNWDAVDDDFKKKWKEAREIIASDDQGSYGGNLHKHSKAIKELFPEVRTTQELHDKEFKNLIRLGKWAEKKFSLKENNIKIIAFGHENYVLQILDEKFNESGIGNCESIGVTLDEKTTLSFRNKETKVD